MSAAFPQQLGNLLQPDRENEDVDNICRARTIAKLYFDSLTDAANKVATFIESSLHTHRNYLREDTSLSLWTDQIVKLTNELSEIWSELNDKIAKEASLLSVPEQT